MSKIRKSQIDKLRTAMNAFMRAYKVAESSGSASEVSRLNPSDMQALLYIEGHAGCIASDVGAFLGVVPTTTSTILDRMSKRGLIRRSRTEENRRIVRLALTASGEDMVAAIVAEQNKLCSDILSRLEGDERDAFVVLLSKVSAS